MYIFTMFLVIVDAGSITALLQNFTFDLFSRICISISLFGLSLQIRMIIHTIFKFIETRLEQEALKRLKK